MISGQPENAPGELDVLSLIPQRSPFVMLDSLTYTDSHISRSTFLVRAGAPFVEDGMLGEAGLIENIAQTAAARTGWISLRDGQPVPVGYIGAVQNLRVFDLPKINEEIKTEITVKNQIFNVTVIEGKIESEGRCLIQCEMKIFISNQ